MLILKYFVLYVGVGNSTLGNYLLGHNGDNGPFKTGSSFDPVTLEPNLRLIEINGRTYNLIDTPGLFDIHDGLRSEIVLKKLANTINQCSYGIQAIILVLKKHNIGEINRRIQLIKGYLGEGSLNNMLVAFTYVGIKETDKDVMRKTFNSDMKNFLKKIGNRWIVSPHPNSFVLDDVAKKIAYKNINETKNIIDTFNSAYTTEMFNNVRRAREEAEKNAKLARKEAEANAKFNAQEERLRSCEKELERIHKKIDEAGRRVAMEEAKGGCFSLDTIVTLENGKKIEMSKVRIGDKIACGVFNGDGIVELEYSEVYLIAHLDKHQRTEFLKVEYTKPDGMTGNYINSTYCHLKRNI